MKRKNIIIILLVLWIVSMIVMAFVVYDYIDNKRYRLRSEIREEVKSLFEGQTSGRPCVQKDAGFFDVIYSGRSVRNYKKVNIPKPSKDKLTAVYLKDSYYIWKQRYGELESLYELNWRNLDVGDVGWNIIRIYCDGFDDEDFIRINTIFPYKVGLKKSEWGNSCTVEQAVNEAFEFYTTNPKSSYSERYSKGSVFRIMQKLINCKNEYFSIVERGDTKSLGYGNPIYRPKGMSDNEVERTMPVEDGWMHNGFYRVFIAATPERCCMIKEYEGVVDEDRNRLLKVWGIWLTAFFMLLIIPLTIKEIKVNKKKSETLYQRLVRLCNPKIFIDNYDKEKVEKANTIYKKLLETTPDNNDALKEIQIQASSELGINFIDKAELKDLREKVNPKRFIKPYNAEKVSLANELYAILAKDNLTYGEMIEVKEKAKEL